MGGMRSIFTGFTVGMLFGAFGFFAAAGTAERPPRGWDSAHVPEQTQLAPGTLVIRDDPGGYIAAHAVKLLEWQEKGISLRFAGQCDSACTLYLALPYEQTCISNGASFRFHAPTAENEDVAKFAKDYMLLSYPAWVRSWIEEKGGLSSDLITMDYAYARQHMRACETEEPKVVHIDGEDQPS
jgi:hypothetical protein